MKSKATQVMLCLGELQTLQRIKTQSVRLLKEARKVPYFTMSIPKDSKFKKNKKKRKKKSFIKNTERKIIVKKKINEHFWLV